MSDVIRPRFFIVPFEIVKNRHVAMIERLLFSAIHQMADENGCTLSNKDLADVLHISPNTVAHGITNLVKEGYVQRSVSTDRKTRYLKTDVLMRKMQDE